MIKIRPIRETDRRFCRENDLDWVSNFKALGINYDVKNLRNITVKNIEDKIDSMRKIIQLWMFRNITPMGRFVSQKVSFYPKSLIFCKHYQLLQIHAIKEMKK